MARFTTITLLLAGPTVVVAAALWRSYGVGAGRPGTGASAATDKIKPQLAQQLEQRTRRRSGSASNRPTSRPPARSRTGTSAARPCYDALHGRRRAARARRRACWTTPARRTRPSGRPTRSGSTPVTQALVDKLAGPRRRAVAVARRRDYARGGARPRARTSKEVNAVEWGIANINADDVWVAVRRHGRGHHRREHRHRRAVRPPGAGRQVPRQQRRRHVQPQLQLVRRRRHLRRPPRATPTATAPTRWARWSATTAPPTRSASRPGAKWIAANGCCPSDAALIASGQWMLAPTDLDGPEPRRRPSARTSSTTRGARTLPSNDPFMEDIEHGLGRLGHLRHAGPTATAAPGCQTSGSPGSRIINYSVGAYDINNNIAGFSSPRRRPGRRDQAEHLRPGRQRPVQPARQHVRRVQRHLDGRAARRRRDRAALVGSAVPGGRHRRHPGAARRHRDRHANSPVRRHRRRQQRLRRGPARRAGAARAPRRSATPARWPARSPTRRPATAIEGAEVDDQRRAEPRPLTTGADGTYSAPADRRRVHRDRLGVRLRDARPPRSRSPPARRPPRTSRSRPRAWRTRQRHGHRRLRPRLAAVREGHASRARRPTTTPTRAPAQYSLQRAGRRDVLGARSTSQYPGYVP